jgi:RNA polymerase sigma-70 factor (ECF subfamily)
LDEWRKRQRRKKIPFADYIFPMDEMTSPYGLTEDSAIKRETRQNVEDLLSCLPEQYRSILYLREYESFSYSEIEEALDLTENQVKVTLHRARKKLVQLADEQWREKHDKVPIYVNIESLKSSYCLPAAFLGLYDGCEYLIWRCS